MSRYDPMVHAEFSFSEFISLGIAHFAEFFASQASLYTLIKFSIKIFRFIQVLSKMEYM